LRSRVAGDVPDDGQRVVAVTLNGVPAGSHPVPLAGAEVLLPPETAAALRLGRGPRRLSEVRSARWSLDSAVGTLVITVDPTVLSPVRLDAGRTTPDLRLSPETWGAYANYFLNARQRIGDTPGRATAWGGLVDINVFAPDLYGFSRWSYDSERIQVGGPVRLDSAVGWRPLERDVRVQIGDAVSSGLTSIPGGRPYRFLGAQVGTDFSARPGFSTLPVPTIGGSALAQSTIDIFINGQRAGQVQSPGGAFSVPIPQAGRGTSVIVTDVTGRTTFIPLEVPRVDPGVIREGLTLWTAAAGLARFNYGTLSSDYGSDPYGYASVRHGLTDRLTLNMGAEGGRNVQVGGLGANTLLTPWLALSGGAAVSRSARGTGQAARLALTLAGPWNLTFDARGSFTFGAFDDVVSVSLRNRVYRRGTNQFDNRPPESEYGLRLGWQFSSDLMVAGSFQRTTFAGERPIGFYSANLNWRPTPSIPVFFNLSRTTGARPETTFIAGVSFVLGGGVNVSAAAGSDWVQRDQEPSAGVSAIRPLGQENGDSGWRLSANRVRGSLYVDGEAEVRTGSGIPGVAFTNVQGRSTAYVLGRGSVGIVGGHAFFADPVQSGVAVAEVGAPGVPVQVNGWYRGRTGSGGKRAIVDVVPDAPTRVALDTANMPTNVIAGETDRRAIVRRGGGTVVRFNSRQSDLSATVTIRLSGAPPPFGSMIVGAGGEAPLDREGGAFLPEIGRNETLTVLLPGGLSCRVQTSFNGRGGLSVRIGPFECEE
jgi:outer membrane usher protein